jgi:hypothetical protein
VVKAIVVSFYIRCFLSRCFVDYFLVNSKSCRD